MIEQVLEMMPYERFEAWQLAHRLALDIYAMSDAWPRSERYELTTQVRRAALSIPANIAEGSAKRGSREFRRYLDISLGSLSELAYYLVFARDRGLLEEDAWRDLEQLRNRVGQATWGLLRSMARSCRL